MHDNGAHRPPTVDDLSAALGLDETIVRRALRELVHSGHLRRTGDGHAIMFDPWATRDRIPMVQTARDLADLGYRVTQRLLPHAPHSREADGRLEAPLSADVLLSIADRPVSLARWWADHRIVPGFKRSIGKGAAPLDALRGVAPSLVATHAIGTRRPTATEADILSIPNAEPCLEVETVAATESALLAVGAELFAGASWRIPLPSAATLRNLFGDPVGTHTA